MMMVIEEWCVLLITRLLMLLKMLMMAVAVNGRCMMHAADE